MDYVILVRMSGEITLKSPGVVKSWINMLMRNIGHRLYRKGMRAKNMFYRAGRIIFEFEGDPTEACTETSRVFGVREAILCIRVPNDIESISNVAIDMARNWTGTFAVRTNRYKEYPYTSLQVNAMIGEKILEANKNLKVDLMDPDNLLEIEIREDHAFIYKEKRRGFGGLPYGVSGKAVALCSGGIDSSLAAWLMMKRGMKIVLVHAVLSPYYSNEAKERFYDAYEWLRGWVPSGRLKAYLVPIGDIHSRVRLPALKYRCIFCKMLMFRIAEYIAKIERAHALVTGEVLSQVASQTPPNILAIDSVVDIPVFRPVIYMDKDEIDHMAQKIGLYKIVARDVGKCRLVPKTPATSVDPETARKLSSIITDKILVEAVERAEKVK